MVRVAFLHPDLGIGGAERAVIDAALALKSRGHDVQFVTAHHDPSHCFEETKNGTFRITAVGDWLPRSIFDRFYAMCAYVRMIYAAIYLVFFSGIDPDLIFCDQISACTPILCWSRAKILFYCHFPDMLLTQRQTWLKRMYRKPIDWLEEWTTGLAHTVLVNSKFTAGVFKDTFQSLSHMNPQVLYPIPEFSGFNEPVDPPTDDLIPSTAKTIFLSINRYERKKNLPLAIQALNEIRNSGCELDGVHLIVAGGYDDRVTENKEHYQELKELVKDLKLEQHVSFLRSISNDQKRTLLHHSMCLIYTPDKEHFGIVPVEAMYMRCPVIAVNSGGPLETLAHEETGFLCEPSPHSFSSAMEKFIKDPKLRKTMGNKGHERVVSQFSFAAYTQKLDTIVTSLCAQS